MRHQQVHGASRQTLLAARSDGNPPKADKPGGSPHQRRASHAAADKPRRRRVNIQFGEGRRAGLGAGASTVEKELDSRYVLVYSRGGCILIFDIRRWAFSVQRSAIGVGDERNPWTGSTLLSAGRGGGGRQMLILPNEANLLGYWRLWSGLGDRELEEQVGRFVTWLRLSKNGFVWESGAHPVTKSGLESCVSVVAGRAERPLKEWGSGAKLQER